MLVLGIDAHKRTHTVVAVDEAGRKLGQHTTTSATTADHLELVRWADQFGSGSTLGGGGLSASVTPAGA